MNTNTATLARNTSTGYVEVTVGPTPQELMRRAVGAVSSAPLRAFLTDFFNQWEIDAILASDNSRPDAPLRRYTIHILRSAAETAAHADAFGPAERDALYVATFVEGCRPYLKSTLEPGATLDDVFYTVIHEGLRRLDRRDERVASLVRMCLDIGLPDEVDDFYVPRLRQGVLRALKRAHTVSSYL